MTILKEAVQAVLDRREEYLEAKDYYEGDVPETFATARLRRAFRTTGDRSRLNFCRPVVEAVRDRLEIATITGDTQRATEAIRKFSEANDLEIEADEVHRQALVYGDVYVIVWPNADGETEFALHTPETMAMVYDPENPRKKLYAVKLWVSGEAETRMNIYTDDAIRKYRTNTDQVTEGTQWNHVETIDNPFGEVPVFHFRTHRPYGRPEHKDAYDAQNAINKLFVTNMFTIDYQGAPQRYALSAVGADGGEANDFDEGDTERENINALSASPGSVWYMKGVSQMGEFKPADGDVFWKPINSLRDTIASLTGTPAHYLTRGAYNPTGQSLRVAEAPLLKKVQDRQVAFGSGWRDLFRFVLKIEGINSGVTVYWKALESLDELERWDVTLKKINSGLSHRQALREGGYPEEEIDKIIAERKLERSEGLMYQRNDGSMDRAPQTRVNTSDNENSVIQGVE